MFTPRGKFGWYELMTSDTKAAGKFYSDVVGWTAREISSAEGGMEYTTFNLGEAGIAGLLRMAGHTAWIGYMSVDNVDAHIEKIVEAGGKLWRPATSLLLIRPCLRPERPAPPTPGTIGWHELYRFHPGGDGAGEIQRRQHRERSDAGAGR